MWAELAPVGRVGSHRRLPPLRLDRADPSCASGSPPRRGRRGLDLTLDRAGNQWAWWGDPDAAPGRSARRGDGQPPGLGAGRRGLRRPARGGVGLRRARHAAGRRTSAGRPIGIVNFGDEEGARFGIACAGSRLITGALAAERARALTDADGHQPGRGDDRGRPRPGQLGRDRETLRRIGCFVELHVEQGRGLVDLGPAGGGRLGDLAARPVADRPARRGQPCRHHPAGRPRRPDARLRPAGAGRPRGGRAARVRWPPSARFWSCPTG